ncbi:MAG: hypothetical protein ACK5PS_07600 [Desulfopila sp.]
MQTFLVLLFPSFLIISCAALLINFCRRRLRRTRHPLSGMCEKSGGALCACCGAELQATRPQSDATAPPTPR